MAVVTRDVKSISKSGSPKLKGDVTLSQGSNVALTQSGQDIQIAGTPAGSNTEIQYNSSGSFGASPDFRFVTSGVNRTVYLGVEAGNGELLAPNAASTNVAGSELFVFSGNGNGTGAGGSLSLGAGTGGATNAAGGVLYIYGGGSGGNTGTGGNVEIYSGSGNGTDGNSGDIILSAVPGAGAGTTGKTKILGPAGENIATFSHPGTDAFITGADESGEFVIAGADAVSAATIGTSVRVTGGTGVGARGGAAQLKAGPPGTGSFTGADVSIFGGQGGSTGGAGGKARVVGGDAQAGNGNGGDVELTPGAKNGSGTVGKVIITTLTGGGTQMATIDNSGAIGVQAIPGGGLAWTEVTGTSQTMAVDNGYIANNAALVTLTLPDTAAVGKVVRVVGKGAGGWKVAQNASEIIHFGNTDTTTGTGGSLASTNRYDAVHLICTVADTEWTLLSSVGAITIV